MDLLVHGQLINAVYGPKSSLFLTEMLLGGLAPILLLASRGLREQHGILGLASALTMFGVILNRASIVMFARTFRGPMPNLLPPAPYAPSVYEWRIALAPIAATILLYSWAVRNMPILPKEGSGNG